MRLLCIHSARLAVEAATAASDAAAVRGPPDPVELSDCLTVAVTVEPGDLTDGVAAQAAAEVRETADKLAVDALALVPTEHLSDRPADDEATDRVLDAVEAALTDDFTVVRAPRDWFLALDLETKGHPYAAQSVRVTAADVPAEAPPEHRDWLLLTPDGEQHEPLAESASLSGAQKAVMNAGGEGAPGSTGSEPSVDSLLSDHGFASVDRDTPDGIRYLPRGALLRRSLRDVVEDRAAAAGATPVESEAAAGQAPGTAGGTGRELIEAMDRSTVDAPVRLFEVQTKPTGRASGSNRHPFRHQRTATVPTLTSLTPGGDSARAEFETLARLTVDVHDAIGLDPVLTVRTSSAFWERSRDWLVDLVRSLDRPALVDRRPETPDWTVRLDLAVAPDGRAPVETGTVALEPAPGTGENRARLHCEPVGSIEAVTAALLSRAAAMDRPRLPTWLAPTQVRFVPVESEHLAHCESLAETVAAAGIRVDVDDRTDDTVGRRLSAATTDWVPYLAVVGDQEADGDQLKVQVRANGTEVALTVTELVEAVQAAVSDTPRSRWSLPRRCSQQPRFAETT
ncbi:threonyl-tRNA synthetase editing domain-containing protein [Haloarchaeobius sp. HME9146]|uniref:threonyl-tRNA synthetase editing domain-containing protein n=1 Tax=Haloarchaeobius sp. HME9146 TaxID=2978732 RepID=UPI0021BFB13D|nr:threonyl-tRNA synthetase editing domain-containing protein [Haloarchaeobius sp. HME9146]MCT9097736.1 His/Gly/Thr/Pro-type tRNA ligase C-terminal domain-containing protein [Haloarchaeobius sp. HME9146]